MTTQEPPKGTMEELEELINNIRRHHDTDSVHIHEFFHHQLQKARTEGFEEGYKQGKLEQR